ncbi:alpha/beta hydrolase [Rhodococcus erythropolis]|uniref:alpha/beta fold hydrolase n=1 Tax=Rhodococcus erythropolis TaxID=1833 RepID=UPI002948D20E|nr:alpha/beta hydrolase [Rhodococcus erythropolis]MDV6211850.1 alpha/beta hydrolase [Rhodococcus erythropolis]
MATRRGAPTGDHTWATAPTKYVHADGVNFTYRELGPRGGVPVVFLHHFAAVLDDWDPRLIDGIAAHHHVITFDNRGVGATDSAVPSDLEQMGRDAATFVRALGHDSVDLLGFSLGGGVAQMLALQNPALVRRMVLAGTGPRGGGGIDSMGRIVGLAYLKAALARKDARHFLFFPRTEEGKRAADNYFARLAERVVDRDKPISMQARLAQLRAIIGGGKAAPDDLSRITVPVFVANGDNDLMVASAHSADLARRLPNSQLTIYPRSGHGGIFQYHREFVPAVLAFLGETHSATAGSSANETKTGGQS